MSVIQGLLLAEVASLAGSLLLPSTSAKQLCFKHMLAISCEMAGP